MKKVIYWLMGEKAGRVAVGTWNWLWGMPVETGGKVAVEVAEESLRSMQESLQQLAHAVSTQVAAYERAKQKYEAKVKELESFERQAMVAQQSGNEEGARLAMTKVIQVEQLLPQLEEQVKQAEQFVNASKDKLNRERIKLEQYKTDMQNMKDMSEINEALSSMAKVNSDLNIDSARSQFEDAKSAVQRRNLRTKAYAELSENPAEKLNADLEQMAIDDAVAQRLQRLSNSTPKQLPE
ncbi:PspA/IM30 family protein [Limnofasciculus baicalensis]|uniref:PspA/IM30 family protein n=1 Tax=Limnofasciculus baicalensis BBK-W-15 TaxID=2699891 RepID=A0AAE3KLU5_9CYAN|nr:PspA/IM30 family protein [Limnofasciculus baicalensis]MCP2728026.1 PspA/IM30 family protein [Limnofasciculus baicalensis BBK-W-15]